MPIVVREDAPGTKKPRASTASQRSTLSSDHGHQPPPTDAGMEAVRNLQRSVSDLVMPVEDKRYPIVEANWFNGIVIVTVCLNTLQLGLEADNPDLKDVWRICENIVTGIFFIEMIIKFFIMRCAYFKDKANWLDAILTMMGVADCWILGIVAGDIIDLQSMSLLRILRLVRLVRVAKIAGRVRPLMLVLTGLYQALLTTFWVFLVLVLVMYMFAVFCTEYIGHGEVDLYTGFSTEEVVIDQQEVMLNFNPHLLFGSMPASMLTLFNIAIGSEWQEVVRPLAIKQPFFVMLFLTYCIVIVFGIMNVIIAIVVDNVIMESKKMDNQNAAKLRAAKRRLLEDVQVILTHVDTNGDGVVDLEEFKGAFYSDPQLQELLDRCSLPAGWTPQELLTMLDNSGDGVLQRGEFTTNLFRLMDGDDFQKICILQAGLNQLKHLVRQSHEKLELNLAELHRSMRRVHTGLFPDDDLDAYVSEVLKPDTELDGAHADYMDPETDSHNAISAAPSPANASSAAASPQHNSTFASILEPIESEDAKPPNSSQVAQPPHSRQHSKASQGNDWQQLEVPKVLQKISRNNGNATEQIRLARSISGQSWEKRISAQTDAQWQELSQDVRCLPYKRIADVLDASFLAMKESFYQEYALLTQHAENTSVSQQRKEASTAAKARAVNSDQEFEAGTNGFVGVPGSLRPPLSSRLRPGVSSSSGAKATLPKFKGNIDDLQLQRQKFQPTSL